MWNLIKLYTQKIDSLIFLHARSDMSLEEEQKIRFFSLVTFLTISICLCFFILHLRWGNVGRSVLILLVGCFQLLCLLAVVSRKDPKVAFRISSSILAVYFLFLLGLGGGPYGTRMLWMLVLPAYFLFLLGKREGLAWTATVFLASLWVIFDPTGFLSSYDYEGSVAARFLLTYGVIAAIAYFGESTRERYANELLNVQVERFKTLCANAPFGMAIIGKDGAFDYVNPKFEEMFGYSLNEVPNGRAWFRSIYPDSTYRKLVIGAWIEDMKQTEPGETRNRIFEVTCKDGRKKLIHFRPVRMSTGQDLMTCEDITERKRAEDALKESELRYRLIVENTHELIMVTEPDGTISYLSPSCYRVLGYYPEELEGKQPWIIHASDVDRMKELHLQALKGSSGTDIEYRIETREGQTRWVSHSWSPIYREGKLVAIISVLRDITESKLAAEALQIKDNAITSCVSGIAIGDFTGNVIYVNPAAVRLWRYDHESELLGRPIREFWLIDEEAEAAWKHAAKTGSWIGELIALKSDGSRADLQVAISLLRKADGKPMAIMGSFTDISDNKRAEQALRESEEKYRTLFEESKDPVIMTTREGVVEDANQAFLDLFGFTREDLPDLNILEIYINHEDRRRFQHDIERDGSVKDYPAKRRKKDGTEIDCLLTSTVRRDKNGKVLGYRGIVRDVTEQKKLQRQLLQAQKMEAIGTLAGGIAHDFNNLLQAILGYTEILLMKEDLDAPDRKRLEVIRRAAGDGAELVSRILAFSKKSDSKVSRIDLNKELLRIERLLRRTLPRMIKIDLMLSDSLDAIDADPTQIEQVILNLGVNAQHAMPDGGQLLIETSNVSIGNEYLQRQLGAKPGKYVLLTVSDNGLGMAPEVMDRIFEPFFTTKANGGGTGLGLAMVHGIVTQHGGYISCHSEPGRGTSFEIYFPVSTTEVLRELADTIEITAFGTETILVVDDDDRIRDMTQDMIQTGGYKVLTARSGEEALEIYAGRRDEVALVILDLIMPGMGGKRCLEELLRIDPDTRVIVASGLSDALARENVTGVRGFVMKPYETKKILRAVRKVLDKGHM